MAKKKLSKKKRRRRLIRRLILLTLLLAFVTTLAIFSPKIVKLIKLAQEAKELVNKSSLDTFMASGTTVIYDTDGNELCTMRESKDMYYVDIGQIPDTLQKSFVVMEDKDFYKHKGIDFKAIIRAVIANTENDEIVQGASTITQQLAKNIFLSQEVTWQRKVKEIFVNILSNTMKYTPSGGSVMINIDELPCSGPGYMIVRTRVSDTGIGMSQEYLTNIFEAFTREQNTTKSKIAGTGLGMSIVKKYVDLLGGTINVESELGKGSTFTVTLKHRIADESYYVKKYIEESETGSEILEGRNILLAEDNDLNAEIAEAILESAGLKIERVEDGIQCVNRIEKMPADTYDMILMDIQMPQMDGYKATQAIRNLPDKDKASIPIVAMTANAFLTDVDDAIKSGMNQHISKPIDFKKLFSLLKKVIK